MTGLILMMLHKVTFRFPAHVPKVAYNNMYPSFKEHCINNYLVYMVILNQGIVHLYFATISNT